MSENEGKLEDGKGGVRLSEGLGDLITIGLAHYTKLRNERNQYHDVLQDIREQVRDCLEFDADAFARMTLEQSEFWGVARHNQTHGWILDRIKDVIA